MANNTMTSTKTTTDYITPIVTNLDYYLVPAIIFIGLLGNTLSFIVFVFTNLKTLSSSVYLAALSISDSGFLICVFFSWMINIEVTIYHEQGWCQTIVYLTYVFSFLSVWYVVAFTIERWIVVLFPFKRGDMCTVKKANIVVTSLALFGFVAYNFGIWTPNSVYIESANGTETTGPYCNIKVEYAHLIHILNNMDTVVTLILPSCIIIVLNLQIIRAVTRINKDRRQVLYSHGIIGRQISSINKTDSPSTSFLAGQQPRNTLAGLARNSSPKLGSEKKPSSCSKTQPQQTAAGQNRVTNMLLVVSTIFLLLNLPSHTIRIYFFIAAIVNPTYIPPTIMLSLQKLFTYIYYINFSINFFLYSLCGNNFRKALWQLLNRPFVCLREKLCTKGNNRGLQSSSVREEMCLSQKRQLKQVDSVVSYNNGKTSMTMV